MNEPAETERGGGFGSSLASYQLLGKIARGGMGTVYVARRAGAHGFQRLYAIKLMHEHLADNEEFAQMFLDEARLAARLHHPNVVPIVDIGNVDGREFVVMDYVEGCSLAQLFKLSPSERPWRAIAKIACDFLTGLHAAHELVGDDGRSLGVIHRDVSPQNVLIGLDGVSRVTDFGIAKAESRMTETRPGLRKGKLAFMAPEQLHDGAIDRRADIFSAGVVLWSALTGEALFAGNSDAATMRNLLQMEIPPPSEAELAPPPALDKVCLKALERDPEDRFQTAQEFVEAIRAAAIELGDPGSAKVVSEWVCSVAADKIEVRRRAIAEVNSNDSSIQTVPVMIESGTQVGSGPSRPVRVSTPVTAPTVWEKWRSPILVVMLSVVVAVLLAMFVPEDPRPVESSAISRSEAESQLVGRPPPQLPSVPAESQLSENSQNEPPLAETASDRALSGPTTSSSSGSGSVAPAEPALGNPLNSGPRARSLQRRVGPRSARVSDTDASAGPHHDGRRSRGGNATKSGLGSIRLPQGAPDRAGSSGIDANPEPGNRRSDSAPFPEESPTDAMERNPYLRGRQN